MTLIEVVGGLALLGTLLVAVLLAKAKYTRQAATADRKLQAVAAADELLTAWRQDPNALPRDGSGPVARRPPALLADADRRQPRSRVARRPDRAAGSAR